MKSMVGMKKEILIETSKNYEKISPKKLIIQKRKF